MTSSTPNSASSTAFAPTSPLQRPVPLGKTQYSAQDSHWTSPALQVPVSASTASASTPNDIPELDPNLRRANLSLDARGEQSLLALRPLPCRYPKPAAVASAGPGFC
ncbi:hypothetical protein APHAL10511_006864 [Amanita phalloides]|nr:hypothetical protein APHAL10511_006864 [Amanita phalloides]